MTEIPSPTAEFLIRLRKADLQGMTIRDVLVLYAIMRQPGSSGVDIVNRLGMKERSAIASTFARLERMGFIEDRREVRSKANPAIFHVKPAGVAFWEEIKP